MAAQIFRSASFLFFAVETRSKSSACALICPSASGRKTMVTVVGNSNGLRAGIVILTSTRLSQFGQADYITILGAIYQPFHLAENTGLPVELEWYEGTLLHF